MDELPKELWFGNERGTWPIYCWESETHALAFLRRVSDGRIWKATLTDVTAYTPTVPVEPRLVPKMKSVKP